MRKQPPRILVVEDDPEDLELLRGYLKQPSPSIRSGRDRVPRFRLESVTSVQEGLDRLAKGNIDVLLLDLYLPDSQGAETVARVRRSDAEVPIVVFTSAGDADTALRALQAGAQDYLVKGELSASLVWRAIRYAIERQRIQAENERLQQRLMEAEKLQSLGVVAAGTAYGFNTQLGIMLDEVDLGLVDLASGETGKQLEDRLRKIRRAAMHAHEMIVQIRSFASATSDGVRELDLTELIIETSGLLEAINPAVSVDFDLQGDLPAVKGDAQELRLIVTNLVLNAFEAIGKEAGAISVATGTVWVDAPLLAETISDARLEEGWCVYLRVRDTGHTIQPPLDTRIFDPFFTTKFAGRGLGLAAVRGSVRRHGGAVRVESEPGGTTFTIFFPCAKARPRARPHKARPRRQSKVA